MDSGLFDDSIGAVMYGSYARGDFSPASDVDVLSVSERAVGSRSIDIANVSVYTPDQMTSARGTLFGMHLARDGIVLFDTDGTVASHLASMGEPDPNELFERIRFLAAVLDGAPVEYLSGQIRVARYLLRTAVYVAAIAAGKPCFSVRELAGRFNDPGLVTILSSDPTIVAPPTSDLLEDLLHRLTSIVGPLQLNPHGGLRNLVVTEWFDEPTRATLGVLVLAGDADQLDYTALSKVIL